MISSDVILDRLYFTAILLNVGGGDAAVHAHAADDINGVGARVQRLESATTTLLAVRDALATTTDAHTAAGTTATRRHNRTRRDGTPSSYGMSLFCWQADYFAQIQHARGGGGGNGGGGGGSAAGPDVTDVDFAQDPLYKQMVACQMAGVAEQRDRSKGGKGAKAKARGSKTSEARLPTIGEPAGASGGAGGADGGGVAGQAGLTSDDVHGTHPG